MTSGGNNFNDFTANQPNIDFAFSLQDYLGECNCITVPLCLGYHLGNGIPPKIFGRTAFHLDCTIDLDQTCGRHRDLYAAEVNLRCVGSLVYLVAHVLGRRSGRSEITRFFTDWNALECCCVYGFQAMSVSNTCY